MFAVGSFVGKSVGIRGGISGGISAGMRPVRATAAGLCLCVFLCGSLGGTLVALLIGLVVNVTTPVDIPDSPFTSLDAMKLSTSAAGRALHELTGPSRNDFKAAKLGVVEEGAWADLLIWKGDPTQNIKLILEESNLILIMKDGRLFKNLTVDPSHESFRGALRPSGYSWSM